MPIFTPHDSDGGNSFDIVRVCVSVGASVRLLPLSRPNGHKHKPDLWYVGQSEKFLCQEGQGHRSKVKMFQRCPWIGGAGWNTPGLLATDIHIQILIFLTIIIYQK